MFAGHYLGLGYKLTVGLVFKAASRTPPVRGAQKANPLNVGICRGTEI